MKLILKAFLFVPLLAFALANEEKESSVKRLRRKLQVATKNLGQNQNNLGLCEGHCTTDAQCRGDLVCVRRLAGDAAPGCALSERHRNSRVNFCVARRQGGTARAPVAAPVRAPATSGSRTAVYVGNDDVSNLGLCQGDCDRDRDCAPGLRCHQRSRGQGSPGCTLSQALMNSDNDFCVSDTSTSSGGGSTSNNGSINSHKDVFALKLYWEAGKRKRRVQLR